MKAHALDLHDIRRHVSVNGYAYIDALPPGVDFAAELAGLGPLLPQYRGELVRDVRPDPSLGPDIVSPYSTSEVTPHTEWYEFPETPPRYVALWCVHPAEGPGGETTLADGYELLNLFTPPERQMLRDNDYTWGSYGLRYEGVRRTARHPVLGQSSGTTIIRFSTGDLEQSDDLSARYVRTGVNYFRKSHVAIGIGRGSVLVWDNWRMLHARRAFSDRRRHLRRVLIGPV